MEKNKNRQIRKNIGILLFLLWTMSAMLILSVAAATSGNGSTGEAGFSWSWTTDNTLTNAAGTFNGSLSGKTLVCNISANSSTFVDEKKDSCGSVTQERENATPTTVTATVTNNTGSTIKIADIACDKASVSGLAVNGSLESGESFTISLTATPTSDIATTSNQVSGVVTITYTVVENVDIVFYGAENATFTCGEQTVSGAGDSATVMQAPGTAITLPDVTVNGGTFMGWRIGDGSVQPSGTSVTINSDSAVYPVILSGSEVYPYTVNGTTYCFWEDAAYAAGTNGTIILNQNYTLPTTLTANGVSPAGGKFVKGRDGALSFTVPTGVTLLVPFDSANTLIGSDPSSNLVDAYENLSSPRSEYRNLIMPAGTNLTVASGGAICISSRIANQFVGQLGSYGAIYMNANSNITIQSGANLYAWGYIFYGDSTGGTVNIQNGGTVYEPISIMDYPGSSSLTNTLKSNGVFPMRAYTVRNVEVPMTLQSGAKEYVSYCLWGNRVGTHPGKALMFSNAADGSYTPVFQLASGTTITKSFKNKTQYITVNGDVVLNPLNVVIDAKIIGGEVTFSSSETPGFILPSGFDVTLAGGTMTLNDNVVMVEGSKLTIAQGAVADTNGKNLYLTDDADDVGAVQSTNGCSITVQNVHGDNYTRVAKDAVLDINGTLKAGSTFYTSANKAEITSSKGTGRVELTGAPAETTIKVKDASSSYQNIKYTNAQLKNADGSYLNTSANNYSYDLNAGKWRCETHTDVATDTTPVDHICDVCGLNPCSPCVDADTDFVCDTCNKKLCVHETIEPVEASAPTCTEDGVKAHHKCTTCGAQFADAEGTTPVTAEELAEPAAGHTMTPTEAKDPTCTEAGNIAYWTCDICGKVYSDEKGEAEAQENSLVLQPTGHGWAHEDGEFTTTTTATCTEPGIKTDTCSCGEIRTEDAEALGHDEVAHEAQVPTCTEVGWDAYVTCSRCDYTTYVEKEALNHDIVIDKAVDATCTATGLTEGSHCSRCDGATVAQQTVPMADHTSGEPVVENKVEASCTENGSYDNVVKCSVCGKELSRETVTVSTNGHTPGAEATCTAAQTCTICGAELVAKLDHDWATTLTRGETQHWYDCSRCDETKDAADHSYTWTTVKEANCYQDGSKNGKCACGATATEVISATGNHSYSDTYTTENGSHWKACTTSGCAAKSEEGACADAAEKDHKCDVCKSVMSQCDFAVKGDVKDPGNCVTKAVHYAKCSICGAVSETETLTGEIDSTKHTGNTDVRNEKAATCAEEGYTGDIHCSGCNVKLESGKIVAKLTTHTYPDTWTRTKAPSCTEKGSEERECSVCKNIETREVEMVDHTLKDMDAKAPTCTETGLTAGKKCSVCGTVTVAQEEIPAVGHTAGEVVKENEVAATCDNAGSYDNVVKCSVCGAEISRETVTIDALGHEEVSHEAKAPTCTEIGWDAYVTCNRCDYTTKVEKTALGHTNGTPVKENEVKSTCNTQGSYDNVVYCTVCKVEISREKVMLPLASYNHTAELAYRNVQRDTHETYYPCCGKTNITNEEHDYFSYNTDKCACGSTPLVKVYFTRGTTRYYNDLQEAFDSISAEGKYSGWEKSIITLYEDVDLGSETLLITSNDKTEYRAVFDLNGKKLTADGTVIKDWSTNQYAKYVPVHLWIKDTAGGAEITSRNNEEAIKWYVDNGNLRLGGGKIGNVYLGGAGVFTVSNGATVGNVRFKNSSGKAAISGGTIESMTMEGSNAELWIGELRTAGHADGGGFSAVTTDGYYDSVGDGVITNGITFNSGKAEISAGEIGGIIANGGEMAIYGGTIKGGSTDIAVNGGYVKLYVYNSRSEGAYFPGGLSVTGTTLEEMLGYVESAYMVNGTLITPTEDQTATNADTTVVKACVITWKDGAETVKVEKVLSGTVPTAPNLTKQCHTLAWDADITEATGNKTYTAVWTANHTEGAAVVENNVDATCTADGSYDNVVYCSICKEELSRDTIKVSANGHTEGAVVVENTVAATCTDKGSYDNVVYCTVCDAELSRESVDTAALNHDLVDAAGKEETCTEDGYSAYKACSRCDYIEGKEVIPAAHKLTRVEAKAPTCTEIGWDAYEKCSVCDHTAYVEKPALGHDEKSHEAKTPTCTESGWGAYVTCSRCDYSTYEEEVALGHDMVAVDGKAATCTEAGYSAYTDCSRCDHIEGKNVLAATGHVNTTSSTVQNDNGTHTTTVTCKCGHVVSDETVTCTDAGNGSCACGRVMNAQVNVDNKTKTEGIWTITGTTMNVKHNLACVVLVEETDGIYTRLTATANANGGYDFDVSSVGAKTVVIAVKGDLDNNGKIRTQEIVQIKNAQLGNLELTPLKFAIADVDGNGKIRTQEIVQIKNAQLGNLILAW